MKTKKNILHFAAGMLAATLMFVLAGPALAASGIVAYNQIGVRVLTQQMLQSGETYTAPNGQQVPASITYTDPAGGKTNYLSVRQLSELLDADISWNANANSVDIGVLPVSGTPTITSGVSSETMPSASNVPSVPEYGRVIGALEEIDPKSVEGLETIEAREPGRCDYYTRDTRIQYGMGSSFPEMTVTADTENGQYLLYSVTNHGKSAIEVSVARKVTITAGRWEMFSTVCVEPGQTLLRAFRIIKDSKPFERTFCFSVYSAFGSREESADLTVSLMKLVNP